MNATPPNFSERIIAAASARPNKVAMTMLGPKLREITFGTLIEQVRSVAFRLVQEGISIGDRVAIISENHPNWAIAYLAIIYRGAVATPLDPAVTAETLASFLSHSETKLAFISPSSFPKFRHACSLLGREITAVNLQPLDSEGAAAFDDWVTTPILNDTGPAKARETDLALLMYTSGTSGKPKGVQITHGNILAQVRGVEGVMKISDREVVLSILPLFHAYSQVVNLWLATLVGAKVVYLNSVSSTEIEEALKNCAATTLIGVPRLWYLFHGKIFDAVRSKPALVRWLFKSMLVFNGLMRDLVGLNAGTLFFARVHAAFGGKLRLAVSGGAIFDEAAARDFYRLGFTILQGYGLTETSGAVTATRFEDNKIGSVGKPIAGVQVKIDNPTKERVGEILIRGPIVTGGYYRNPEADREAFTDDGWFRSGDLGRFDDEGHLRIVGRKKDVIVLPSGKNVFPEDVEAHYERSPLVGEICVVGKPNLTARFKFAEGLTAFVVPNFDSLRAQNISNAGEWIPWELENLGRQLPEYQRVHDFILRTDPLPRTTTRKVRRFELQQELETLINSRGNGPRRNLVESSGSQQMLNSLAGRTVHAILLNCGTNILTLDPAHNLEIDLGLDSLGRIEAVTRIEQALRIRFEAEEMTSLLTVGDLLALASQKFEVKQNNPVASAGGITEPTAVAVTQQTSWSAMLDDHCTSTPELMPLLNRKWITVVLAYLLLRLIYLVARIFFRLEVSGVDILERTKAPYLICPNHQSYIDPFLVCSVLPPKVLPHILHVGASGYFKGSITSRLARLINVVPIDPDAHLLRAMRAGATILRKGKILNVYPEGRRSFDGELGVFKKGAAILATELRVPVIPVALDGTYRIWPRGSLRFGLAKVTVAFGKPIEIDELTFDQCEERYEKVTTLIRERVHQMLEDIRKM